LEGGGNGGEDGEGGGKGGGGANFRFRQIKWERVEGGETQLAPGSYVPNKW
jgi:hypothetical protein